MPPEKETLSVRIPSERVREIENLANEKGLSKSDAARRIIRQGIQLEEKDLAVVSTEDDAIPDGGTLQDRLDDIEDHQTGIEQQNRDFQRFAGALALGLLWLGIETSIGLPSLAVLVTGPLVILLLALTYYPVFKRLTGDSDD